MPKSKMKSNSLQCSSVIVAGLTLLLVGASNITMLSPTFAQETKSGSAEQRGTLTVKFTNLRNNKGILRVGLFNNEKGYPDKADKALRTESQELKALPTNGGEVTLTFTDLPIGTYAIAAIHDENANGKLDTHWYGKPREGVAASNNPRPKMRAARFNEAKFDLSAATKSIDIAIWYP